MPKWMDPTFSKSYGQAIPGFPLLCFPQKTYEGKFLKFKSQGITAFAAKPFKIPNLLNAIMR
jgi:hypothetical protein